MKYKYVLIGVLGQLAFAIPMLFKALPVTSGWFLAAASEAKTRIPYKDFFWHMPPGSLFFEGYIPSLFPNSFIGHDLAHLIYWLLLWIFLFLLIAEVTSPQLALLVTYLSSFIYFVQPGNIISGYYETSLGLQIAGLYFLVRALHRHRKLQFLVAGVFFGMSLSVRMSAALFVAAIMVLATLSIFRIVKNQLAREFRLVAAGVLLPWIAILVWTMLRGNSIQMARDIFQTDSKAGLLGSAAIFSQVVTANNLNVFLVVLLAIMYLRDDPNAPQGSLLSRLQGMVAIMSLAAMVLKFPSDLVQTERYEGLWIVTVIILIFLLSRIQFCEWTASQRALGVITIVIFILLLSYAGWKMPMNVSRDVLVQGPNWEDLAGFARTLSVNAIDVGVLGLASTILWPGVFGTSVSSHTLRVLGLSVIAQKVVDSVAGGAPVETWIIGISLGLVVLLQLGLKFSRSGTIAVMIAIITVAVPGLILVQRAVPYEWTGVNRTQFNSDSDKSFLFKGAKFTLEASQTEFYQQLQTSIMEERIGQQQVLFSMRNVGLSEVFDLNRFPMSCVVLWFDVCPENQARESYIELVKKPPVYALVSFESDDVINANENFWGDGSDSYQRKIQQFVQPGTKASRYMTLVEWGDSDDGYPITRLLKRIDKPEAIGR